LAAVFFFDTGTGLCTSRSAQVELQFELFFSPGKQKNILLFPRTMAANQPLAIADGGMGMEVPVLDTSVNAGMCAMLLRNIQAMEKRVMASIDVSFNCLTRDAHAGCRLRILVGRT
jgi:hypothetical protein